MENDGGGAGGALGERLPVTRAEDLAGDLRAACRGDLDELDDGRGESVTAGKEVADDGLEMAVHQPRTRMKGRVAFGPCGFHDRVCGCESVRGHLRAPALAAAGDFDAALSRAVALSAPVGSSSCMK